MSGIYIPGVTVPEDNTILLRIFPESDGKYYTEQLDIDEDILDQYFAIPVPDHGRLIDADALMKKGMPLSFSVQKWVQEVDIACAPTIIPADLPVMHYPQVPGITPTVIAEEVYDKYTDTAGNVHWTGTHSGKHIIPADKEGEG